MNSATKKCSIKHNSKNKLWREQQREQQEKIRILEKEIFCLKSIIKELPGSVYWKDKDGVYLGRNAFSTDMAIKLEIEPPDSTINSAIGKTDYDYFTKDVADQYRKHDLYVMETGKELVAEEVIPISGENIVQLSFKKPLYDESGEIVGIVGNTLDITDKKRAEEYLLKHETAQKVIKFSNLVAGSIAHELKNPLGGIRLQMQALQNMDVEKIDQKNLKVILNDLATAIIKAIDATTYVIDGMLKKVRAFATGETHNKDLVETSIRDDIEHLLQTYPFENNQKGLVKVFYKNEFSYIGDKVLTSHVLSNLMKNALHAIGESCKENATITITTETNTEYNLLLFRDTATGIEKNFIDKIFNQFETKKSIHGGTGLGLAFCKSVMKDGYGGDITCDSVEGKYTEFTLKFPLINKL